MWEFFPSRGPPLSSFSFLFPLSLSLSSFGGRQIEVVECDSTPNFSVTGAGTFYGDQFFRVLYFGTNFFWYWYRYFYPGPIFSGSGNFFSGPNFSRTKIFRYRYHPKRSKIPPHTLRSWSPEVPLTSSCLLFDWKMFLFWNCIFFLTWSFHNGYHSKVFKNNFFSPDWAYLVFILSSHFSFKSRIWLYGQSIDNETQNIFIAFAHHRHVISLKVGHRNFLVFFVLGKICFMNQWFSFHFYVPKLSLRDAL